MNSSALNPSSKSFENYLPFVADTSDLQDLDEEFSSLVENSMKLLVNPTLIQTQASFFETLIPKSLRDACMWIVRLPDEFSLEVDALARQFPTSWQLTSVDLRTQEATIEWHTASHRIVANANTLWSLSAEPIVVAIVTPSRTALSMLVLDEDFLLDVSTRRFNCGHKYFAEAEYNADELDAAMTRSVLQANQSIIDEDGLRVIQLDTETYR